MTSLSPPDKACIQRRMHRSPDDVVIVSAVRTPLCRARKGQLAKVPPSTLLSTALKGCLEKASSSSSSSSPRASSSEFCVSPRDIEDICIGNVLSPPSGYVSFRMAQISCGIPHTAPLQTVNRQCSSGLQAIANIANSISSDEITIGIGGGVESMSFHPMNKVMSDDPPDVDWDVMDACQEARDCLIPMGITSENLSKMHHLSRVQLDTFAWQSHIRAYEAQTHDKFQNEIVPVGNVTADDGIRPDTTLDGLSRLKPVFDPQRGTTTAGNSSQMADGASSVLLMKRREAVKRKLNILGVWRGYVVKGVPPHIMGIGPAVAIPAVLDRVGLSLHDIDLFEINEAFASQASWCVSTLNLDSNKVNVNGGAIALGHPLGCTGARQVTTLLHEMNRTGKRFGVVSMCVGTGMGAAAVLEVEGPMSAL